MLRPQAFFSTIDLVYHAKVSTVKKVNIMKIVCVFWLTDHLFTTSGLFYLFYFFKRFYLFIHERPRKRERERERERQRCRQREKQAPCRQPDVGLDPGTPGSRPELKANAQPLSHPGIPVVVNFYVGKSVLLFLFSF